MEVETGQGVARPRGVIVRDAPGKNDGEDEENVDQESCDVKSDEEHRPYEHENKSKNEEPIAHKNPGGRLLVMLGLPRVSVG